MKQVSYLRVLWWNFYTLLRWQHCLFVVLLFGLLGWWSAAEVIRLASENELSAKAGISDVLLIGLAGPVLSDNSFVRVSAWFLPHLLFFYLIGDMAQGELSQRGYYIVPCIGSRIKWWIGKLFALLVFAAGYTLLGIGTFFCTVLTRLPWSSQADFLSNSSVLFPFLQNALDTKTEFFWIFLLFFNTTVSIGILQITLSVLWRNAFYGFVTANSLVLFSLFLGSDNPQLVRWLPGSHSMLLRHTLFEPTVPNFSLFWSFVYNVILSMFIIGLSGWYIHRMDILHQ